MSEKKSRFKELLSVVITVIFCVFINLIGKFIAHKLSLPVRLDSFGTVISSITLGPVCGAIVGATSNVIVSFWNYAKLIYSLTGIAIGFIVGVAAKKKYHSSLFHVVTIAGFVALATALISSVLNLIFVDGKTDNVWGDGVRDFMMTHGLSKVLSSIMGQLYIDFADKIITIVGIYGMFKLVRFLHDKLKKGLQGKKKIKKDKKKSGAVVKSAALIVLAFFSVSAGLLGLSTPTYAVTDEESPSDNISYIRTVYNSNNGLVCGHATDVVQTLDGVIWAGSYSGLYRYNGTNFKFMSEFDSVKNVNCLFVDSDGRLWIGTNDNGIAVMINEEIAYTLTEKDGLPSDSIRCITKCADGDYYIGTSDRMVIVRAEMGLTVKKTIDELTYVKSASADALGHVAAVNSTGELYILSDQEVIYNIDEESKDTFYTCCQFSKDTGDLYAGTSDGRVIVYKVKMRHAKKEHEIVCEGLSGINCVSHQDGKVWVLSDNGMGTIENNSTFTSFETEEFSYSLENMTVDYQGHIWIASSRMGLMQLSASAFTDMFTEYGIEECVVNTSAFRDDLLFVGTDGGLLILDTQKRITVSNDLTKRLKDTRIRCIINDSSGNLWICTYGQGLLKYDKSGKISTFEKQNSDVGVRVRVCMELSDGTIAVGGDKSLYFIDNDKITLTMPYGDQLGTARILCMLEMLDGSLLCGTDGNGIAVVKDGKVIKKYSRENGLSSDVILRMVKDTPDEQNSENVFIATGNGICYFSNGDIRELTNFPYSNNFDIILNEDSGEVFVTGSAGIHVLDRTDLIANNQYDYQLLNFRHGLTGSLTSNSWNAVDNDKNVYLSTDRGIFIVNLDNYKTTQHLYRLMIQEMILDGVQASMKRGAEITVPKNVTSIELVPEVINYTLDDPDISYYLEGFDSKWKTVSQSELSNVVYTNLPAGKYVFHLAIIDKQDESILEECAYSFQKEIAIYDNNWFLLYMILVAFLFIGWVTWFITRRKTERTLELQETKLALALQQVQMGNETILAIAKTVDAKDVRTSRHSQRVADYSVMIARRYGFSDEELENIRRSALLHDIGKIGIPDAILNKPARLTDEEYDIMKTHVTRGAEILKDFTLVKHAVDGARYHHERYDGRGYPDHLEGKNIPLYGRIIAIADAFDAMTSNRVYRKQQDMDYVMSELHKGRGTQFDPDLLDLFLQVIDSGEIDIDGLYQKLSDSIGEENNEGKDEGKK